MLAPIMFAISLVSAMISSLAVDPELALETIRAHWGIENKLHWTLDMRFREDDSKVRNANAAQNLNIIRKVAIDLLKADKTYAARVRARNASYALSACSVILRISFPQSCAI